MSKKLYEESNISAIADAIRAKNGSQDTYTTAEMADAIDDIPSGGILIQKNIIANGTYDALLDDNADGYSEVIVNVPSSGNVPIFTAAEWNALTQAQKRALQYAGVIYNDDRYFMGRLYNGQLYQVTQPEEFVPMHSWCSSDNVQHTYTFTGITPLHNPAKTCLAVMVQNGNSPSWDVSAGFYPELVSGSAGNGNYAIAFGEYEQGCYARSFSSGNNWNNSALICFAFTGDIDPNIIELTYLQEVGNGTYNYTYTADKSETLLLIIIRGGTGVSGLPTVTGLTETSRVTASGSRHNVVYYGEVESGDTVSISDLYSIYSNGSLFVVLMSV